MNKVVAFAFDCFGTVFNMSNVSTDEIKAYVEHVNNEDFSPFNFPDSWYNLKAHSDSAIGISRLREAGFKCITMSNGSVELLREISDKNNIEWDGYIDFVKSKVYKPNLKAYTLPEKIYGFKPELTVMVTANPTFGDIEGAEHVGMIPEIIRDNITNDIINLAIKYGASKWT